MSFRVYCSIPTHTQGRDEILMEVMHMTNEFSKKFPYKENIEMDYVGPGEGFDPNCVGDANVVLLMHQNNKFDFDRDSLSRDTLRDFDLARDKGKKVFLLYRTKDGKLSTYSVMGGTTNISGVPGTTDYFNTFMRNNIYDKKDAAKHVAQIGKQKEVAPPPPHVSDYPMIDRIYNEMKVKESIIVAYDRRLLI